MYKIRLIFCLLLIVGLQQAFTETLLAGQVYKLSMLPADYPEKINAIITPVAKYLSDKTGESIVPVLTKNFAEYEADIQSGKIAIGYETPVIYTRVADSHEAVAMAVNKDGKDRLRGVIITRPDSDIHTVNDLRHKSIMIVGKTATGGFLSQKLFLSERGLDFEKECDVSEAPDNKEENVIISVSVGDVDAGFLRENSVHVADQYIQPGSITVMQTCAWMPNWTASVARTLPDALKAQIKSAILQLGEDTAPLKALHIKGFKPAEDTDFDVVRKLL